MNVYGALCAQRVLYYRKFGAHPARIVQDRHGIEYVIGDWAWNYKYPNKREFVESARAPRETGVT